MIKILILYWGGDTMKDYIKETNTTSTNNTNTFGIVALVFSIASIPLSVLFGTMIILQAIILSVAAIIKNKKDICGKIAIVISVVGLLGYGFLLSTGTMFSIKENFMYGSTSLNESRQADDEVIINKLEKVHGDKYVIQ